MRQSHKSYCPKIAWFLANVLLLSSPALASNDPDQVCNRTTCFARTVTLGDEPVSLLGTSFVEYLWLDVYTAALYGDQAIRSTGEIPLDSPLSLEIRYHREIAAADIVKSAEKALKEQNATLPGSIADDVRTIHAAYRGVQAGDRYELRFVPSEGTTLLFNGTPKVTVPDPEFARYYFRIWLDPKRPLNEKSRRELIGG